MPHEINSRLPITKFECPRNYTPEGVHKWWARFTYQGINQHFKNPTRNPIYIIDETNRYYRIKKGSVVGKARPLFPSDIRSVEPMDMDEGQDHDDDLKEINVPEGHRRLTSHNWWEKTMTCVPRDFGHTSTIKMRIQVDPNQHPLYIIINRPYRTPLNKRIIIDQAIDEMLEAKVIERSHSPWSFPLVVVKKKYGSDRMCVDLRTLNKIVQPVSYPLPLIDNILSLLGNARYFTALDLKSGYWQVQPDNDSKEKTAFTFHRGRFQFNVMLFGLSNATPYFKNSWTLSYKGVKILQGRI